MSLLNDGTLNDKKGNPSSKRKAGYIIGGVGLLMGMTLFTVAIFKEIKDAPTALKVFNTMMILAGALLGVGVVEMFGKK